MKAPRILTNLQYVCRKIQPRKRQTNMSGSYDVSSTRPGGWQKRNTLALTGFFGMALMYSLRYNLSIAIVAMVDHNKTPTIHVSNTSAEICPSLINASTPEGHSLESQVFESPKFAWSEKEQGLIQGSFFWGYVLTQFPGGFLAQRFGAKWVISTGMLFAGLLALLLPSAAVYGGIPFVLAVRVLQGIGEGVIIPSFAVLLGKWTRPSERASLATLIFSGMPFGTAFTMILSGHLITLYGWPSVFYVPGILTILWFCLWTYTVYSTPAEHPTISKAELSIIECGSIGDKHEGEDTSSSTKFSDIPWRSIATSVPVWAILLSHFANTWGHNTLKAGGPKYLHSVLHFDIKQNAYIAATPYIGQWLLCNIVTRLSDNLISRSWITVGTARKLCNTIGQWGTALAYIGLISSSCNRTVAILCYMLCGSFNGAVYGGFIISPVDISPNFAGILEGIVNGISNIAGFGAPYVTGIILNSDASLSGWHTVLWIPVFADFIGNAIFIIFGTAKVQIWNGRGPVSKATV